MLCHLSSSLTFQYTYYRGSSHLLFCISACNVLKKNCDYKSSEYIYFGDFETDVLCIVFEIIVASFSILNQSNSDFDEVYILKKKKKIIIIKKQVKKKEKKGQQQQQQQQQQSHFN